MKRFAHILLIIFTLGIIEVQAQNPEIRIRLGFREGSVVVDPEFNNNGQKIQEIVSLLEEVRNDSTAEVVEVQFCGSASPEGSYELNHRLARERLSAVERIVRKQIEIPDSIIVRNDSYIPWAEFKEAIQKSDIQFKNEVLAIINESPKLVNFREGTQIDERVEKLKVLDEGRVWEILDKTYFSDLRNAFAIIITCRINIPEMGYSPKLVNIRIEPEKSKIEFSQPIKIEKKEPEWMPHLYIKTNALALALGVANFAVEVDITKHLSFTLPIYYSAWNYFTSDLKLRTFAVQPEVRYWFSKKNDGWFVGSHFGFAYYNVAWGGDWRIQDHRRENPTMGGGMSVGYRKPLGERKRWKLEFSLGGGMYDLNYDKFRNEHNGELVKSEKKTFIGVDNAAVTLSYTFDLKKGGK